MKVIHLMSTNDYSGAENVVFKIINGTRDSIDVYYATRKGRICQFLRDYDISNVILINKLSISEIRRIEKEYQPDIIHAHDYKATIIASWGAKKAKVIGHLHNNSPWIKNILHPFCYAFLLSSFRLKKILTVSDAIQKEYIFSKFINKKIENMSNPINIYEIQEKAGEDYNKLYDVCFVGRLTEAKNPLRFIKIVKEITLEIPNIKVMMVGDGELREKCKESIEKLGLIDNIKMLGFKKNPYEFMAKSKVFCLTSLWEGFGLVAIEALALGMPAIVSNVGGLVNIVDDKCGKLCCNDDEFVKEIISLLTNENNYLDKANNAIEKANKLNNYKNYMNKLKKIYSEL